MFMLMFTTLSKTEGNNLLNNALKTLYLGLYGLGHMVNEIGNLLLLLNDYSF